MKYLYSILGTIIIISVTLDYLSFYYKYSAFELVKEMGIAYNLGNTYNYNNDLENNNVKNFEIETWGTILPTKKIINKIKKKVLKQLDFK